MPRIVTYGQQPTIAPKGNFREVHFPQLARLDEGTVEGYISRFLHSDGGGVRDLPRTISMQERDTFGHDQAIAAGSLWEVSINGETGLMSGKGWLADTEPGRLAELMIVSKSLHHNSVDLADIAAENIRRVECGNWWDDDWKMEIHFDAWNLGKTTLVALPAFANARAEISDEITASLGLAEPLIVTAPSLFTGHQPIEICAGLSSLPKWDHFHRAESDIPHKIIVGTKDENGWIPVYGHLGQWDVPHRGYDGVPRYIPRPLNGYREWNQPGPLTDRGQVEAGPIALYGGHVSLRDAANDPRNAWCDVRVTSGKHGPWACGVVRPHVSEDDAHTYVARASRISGHWKGNDLCMIVSCNNEGFNIPGIGFEPGEPGELVASFDPEPRQNAGALAIPNELLHFGELDTEAQEKILHWAQQLWASSNSISPDVVITTTTTIDITVDEDDTDEDLALAALARERELALEDDDALAL